jgi:hypothetical protein
VRLHSSSAGIHCRIQRYALPCNPMRCCSAPWAIHAMTGSIERFVRSRRFWDCVNGSACTPAFGK